MKISNNENNNEGCESARHENEPGKKNWVTPQIQSEPLLVFAAACDNFAHGFRKATVAGKCRPDRLLS